MDERKCMKCGDIRNNGIPICDCCRVELKNFSALTNFLNSFDGDRDDLVWFIKNEIADRQSFIISQCKIVTDMERGIIYMEPQSGNAFAKEKAEEISKLYNALAIIKNRYGG